MMLVSIVVSIFQLLRIVDCWEPHTCSTCVDDEFVNFIDDCPLAQCKNYNVFLGLFGPTKYQCKDNLYLQIDCKGSCVRVRALHIGHNRSETIGWTFGCGLYIIKGLDAQDFRNKGTWRYVDYMNKNDQQYAFEVRFYKNMHDVELVEEHHQRLEKDENKKVEEFAHGFAASALVILAILTIVCLLLKMIRCCCCSKKKCNNESAPAIVQYTRAENGENDSVVIHNTPAEQEQYWEIRDLYVYEM